MQQLGCERRFALDAEQDIECGGAGWGDWHRLRL
jgi:hypothetical protein